MRRTLKSSFYVSLVAVVLFSIGANFFLYLAKIPSGEVDSKFPIEGIVILTGDSSRLAKGFSLLRENRPLLVSGVHAGVRFEDLLPAKKKEHRARVTLGYGADNTRENALESALWARQHHLKSVALVTSDYHVPRSLVEFKRVAPEIEFHPLPVIQERHTGWYFRVFKESLRTFFSMMCAFLEGI